MEIWRKIPGVDKEYEASSCGRIRSFKRSKTPRVLAQAANIDTGYLFLDVRIGGKKAVKLVSRLVCSAFHGKPKKGMEANHIDGDYTNNHAYNLEWCSQLENSEHATKLGRYRKKLMAEDVVSIRRLVGLGIAKKALAERFNVNQSVIYRIVNGKDHRFVTDAIKAHENKAGEK